MRQEFDLDPEILYLNSGTESIASRRTLKAIERYQREHEKNPTLGYIEAWNKLWEAQKKLARFFRADPKDLFLRANVTVAFNEFIQNIALPEGAEILATDLEYGAIVNACRLRAARSRLAFRQFHLDAAASEEELVEQAVSAISPKTALFVTSHVMTGNGLLFPIEALSVETRKRGVMLAVDGAHAAGAVDLDFSRFSDIDFYCSNLHKWMLGPKGTGFGWLSKRLQGDLWPCYGGWTSFGAEEPFADFGEGNDFAHRFLLPGTHDFAPYLAISDALDFWQEHGAGNIRERIQRLQLHLEREIRSKLNWRCLSPARRGPLLAFELPEKLAQEGYPLARRILREHHLQVSTPSVYGQTCLRLSPHVYNTEEECERAVEILLKISK